MHRLLFYNNKFRIRIGLLDTLLDPLMD